MTDMKNTWLSWDSVEPQWTWTLTVDKSDRQTVLERLCALGDDTRLFVVQQVTVDGLPEVKDASSNDAWQAAATDADLLFPFFEHLVDDDMDDVLLATTLAVVDSDGKVVERTVTNVGSLLRDLESVDAGFARRFCAPHPALGVYSEERGGQLEVTFGFWSDVFFERDDLSDSERAAFEANAERLEQLWQGVQTLVSDVGGTLDRSDDDVRASA